MARFRLPSDDLEYAVLATLWDLSTASTREIHRRVGEPAGLVYTTIAKVLDRLYDKGLVARERHGKAFVYRARIAPKVVEKARAENALKRLLGSSPRAAVATLVDAVETLDPKLIDELAEIIASRRRSKDGT